MIHRTPTPKKHFVILRNAVVRDKRLSYRATGLLVELLSRPNNWVIDAKRLAASRPDGEGVVAILTALNELEDAGYIRRQRTRVKGKFCWVQDIYDVTSGTVDEEAESAQVAPENGSPVSGFLGHGNLASLEEPSGRTDIEVQIQDHEKMSGLGFARSAPAAEGESFRSSDDSETKRLTAKELNQKRIDDKALYFILVGDKMESEGPEYEVGLHDTADLYDRFRRHAVPINFPGHFFQHLEDSGGSGIDDWLMGFGLSRTW